MLVPLSLFSVGAPRAQSSFFFFNDTATTEIYTLSLHDALPIYHAQQLRLRGKRQLADLVQEQRPTRGRLGWDAVPGRDRKSTRLNSSHLVISYAVFCLKKKKSNRHWRPSTVPTPRAQR